MKTIAITIFLILAASVLSVVNAQPPGGTTPTGASDSSLRDDGVRMRSIELERIKREANKNDPTLFAEMNRRVNAKFPQIKEDFESIQISEAAIITAYKMSKMIDYKLIESSAKDIVKKSKRLDLNLFANRVEPEEIGPVKKEDQKSLTMKDLIMDLDKPMGEFVSSKIFQNHVVVDAEVARKARVDLANLIKASEALSKEAKRLQ